jgi:hypothetical protein
MSDKQKMWAVQVNGPDDVHACADREVADALALVLNRQIQRHGPMPGSPAVVAEVIEWPYGYEAWKASSELLRLEVTLIEATRP